MNRAVTVIDYGIGNIFNIVRALEACGGSVTIATDESTYRDNTHVVLPGVGAFENGMRGLSDRGLIPKVLEHVADDGFLLGICLGMQMLLDTSLEFGRHTGLGLIPGTNRPIPNVGADGEPHKIPHIGWNELEPTSPGAWEDTLLKDHDPKRAVYFVHSFMGLPEDKRHCVATVDYNGIAIPAVLNDGKVFGSQFHPEKSGEVGLSMLRSFLQLR
jgi:glutamine amidotransferase